MSRASPGQVPHWPAEVTLVLHWDARHPPYWAKQVMAILGPGEATTGKMAEEARGIQTLTPQRSDAMSFTLGDNQFLDLTVSFTDARGLPATVNGEVTWTSSDPNVVAVSTPDTTHSEVARITAGNIGSAQITATANADMNPNDPPRPVVVMGTVTVIAGEAVAGTFTPGTPQAA